MVKFFQRFYRTDYMIAYRFIKNDIGILNKNKQRFTPFKNSVRYWYADPLLYKFNKNIYMFYEAYNRAKKCGEIGVAKISNNSIIDKQIVISESFHMSYPFVFDIGNKIYMIPETSSIRKLLLYEAVNFPYEWRLCKVLIDDVEISDATIFKYQDKLYLFASKLLCQCPYKDELHLYIIDNEFNLRPHKLNPIITNNEFTRPAGQVLDVNEKFIRVSQNCSNGEYGKTINFNEIISISENSYQEKNISVLLPDDIPINFKKRLTGTHTYGKCGNFEVIDVRYPVFDTKKLVTFLYKLPFKIIANATRILRSQGKKI